MDIRECDDNELIEALANRGIDVRHIKEFSMTELNNEITRRRMEAERAECAFAEADADQDQTNADALVEALTESIARIYAQAELNAKQFKQEKVTSYLQARLLNQAELNAKQFKQEKQENPE